MKKFRFSSEQLLENKKWRPSAEIEDYSIGAGIYKEIGSEQLFDTKEAADKFIRDQAKELGFLESEIEEMKPHPLVPHTNAGRLFSTVRRMKAEKEMGIPINRRSCFAISTKTGKSTKEMTEQEWENFYQDLSGQLKRNYQELYYRVFPEGEWEVLVRLPQDSDDSTVPSPKKQRK